MPSPTRPRLPLVGIAIAAAVGIATGDWFTPDPRWTSAIAAAALVLAWWHPAALLPAAAAAFATVHVWQWQENPSRIWADAIATEPRAAQITGILTSEPDPVEGAADRWRARMRTETWDFGGGDVRQQSDIIVRWRSGETPHYGDRWTIEGVALRPVPPRNPGEFNAASWLGRQGIFIELRGRDSDGSRRMATGAGLKLKALALAARTKILHTLGIGLDDAPAVRSLIAAITLGARDDVAEEFTAAFRQTGTLHLFSVSGLHVAMFALLLWMVLQPMRMTRRGAVFVIIPMLFFYSLITGAAPSSLRAATMISLALGALLLDRGTATGNSLAAAALLLLGLDTNQLFHPGFQLSFLVVATILLLTPAIDRHLVRALCPDPFIPRRLYDTKCRLHSQAGRAVAGILSISLAAWIGGLPLTALFFHLIPLVSVPANMAAVPLAFVILALGMLSIAAGTASSTLAAIFNATNWGVSSVLLAFVQWAAALPGAYMTIPPAWLRPPAQITVLDLGTGGAQILLTRHGSWLFDSGRARDFATIIEPALLSEGVKRLEAIVITHGDTEHVGGAAQATTVFQPSVVFDSALRDRSRSRRALHLMLHDQGRGRRIIFPGDQAAAGDETHITFLRPTPGKPGRTADDQCVVTRIDHGPFRTLLMSDSGVETETDLLRGDHTQLRADILVIGRHATDMFATAEFLAAVQPRVIVLATPDPFREGSGEPALRKRLAATGAKIFDQSESGAVTITFHNHRAKARGFLDGQTTELTPR